MDLIWKTALIYFVFIIVMKFMGKREIGQLSLFDFIVLLLIADMGAIAIDKKSDYFLYLLPIVVLVIIQKIIAFLSLKIKKLRTLVDGSETVIIYDGKLVLDEMKKQFYNIDDLLTQVRLKNVISLKEIRYLFLETNGEISIFLKNGNIIPYPDPYTKSKTISPLTNSISSKTLEINDNIRAEAVFPLITSGEINKEYLKILNIEESWLTKEIKKQGYDVKGVYYACLDEKSIFIMPTVNSLKTKKK